MNTKLLELDKDTKETKDKMDFGKSFINEIRKDA